jgi:hypothetical protein
MLQDPEEPGIFGAMNKGFSQARFDDWLLFWGSDDWAAGPTVLAQLIAVLDNVARLSSPPDLLVTRGRYADRVSGVLARPTVFQAACHLSSGAYRRALWFGSTPPHQATLIGPGARRYLSRYAQGFRLSADLDYFLELSSHRHLRVQCLDLELVHMATAGVSGQHTQRRLQEVYRAYRRAFGWRWSFPFVGRYIRRLLSFFVRN